MFQKASVKRFALQCHRRFEHITKHGARRGLKPPSLDEIELALVCGLRSNISIFQLLLNLLLLFLILQTYIVSKIIQTIVSLTPESVQLTKQVVLIIIILFN